jgi:16S rRNA processing protein RimM
MTEAAEKMVCVGVITGGRGLQGEVWIRAFTAVPEDVAAYGPLSDETGQRTFRLQVTGESKGRVVARIAGITSRTAADAVRGTRLFVRRSALPIPSADEYYHADLIGLDACLAGDAGDGERYGKVVAVHDYGAGPLLEILDTNGATAFVPFTQDAVPIVDVDGGRLVVRPLPGLLAPVVVEDTDNAGADYRQGGRP